MDSEDGARGAMKSGLRGLSRSKSPFRPESSFGRILRDAFALEIPEFRALLMTKGVQVNRIVCRRAYSYIS